MTRRGWLLFAAMCVIWGIPYLLIRVAVRELTPVTLVFARTGIAALLLLPVALLRDELRPLASPGVPLLAFTVIEIAVPWLLLSHAETRLTSSLTGLLIAAVPLVGAVVTTLTGDRERHGARRWAGLARRHPRRRGDRRARRARRGRAAAVRDRRRRGLLRGRPDRARALAVRRAVARRRRGLARRSPRSSTRRSPRSRCPTHAPGLEGDRIGRRRSPSSARRSPSSSSSS